MDDAVIKSNGNKFVCIECGNENTIPDDVSVGSVVECEFCGIEYRVTAVDEEGNFSLEILEEEK